MKRDIAMPFLVACLGIAIFSAMDAVMKHLSIEIGAYNAMLWRTMISLVMLGPVYLLQRGGWPSLPVFRLHFWRGLALGLSLVMFFWALTRMPIAQGIALSFIAPLIALGLAALFLKEQIARSALGGSVLAFCGVLVILAGHNGSAAGATDWQGPVAILAAAVLYAIGIVVGRPLAQRASPLQIALFFNIVSGSMALSLAPWMGIIPDARHIPALLAATTAANISIMLMAWAYARAETQHLLPVEYTAFLWACLYGWLFFGETVSPTTLAGAALIVIACLWAARGQPRFALSEPDLEPVAVAQAPQESECRADA
jgi:S-adenosylmethionine uptake transporter